MHCNTFSALALSVLGYFSLEVIANSGYAESCNSISLFPPDPPGTPFWILAANCREESGIFNEDSEININSCFINANGVLAGQLNGGFDTSCENIFLSGTYLFANCKNKAGVFVSTDIDTNNYIGNQNGLLACFGQSGF